MPHMQPPISLPALQSCLNASNWRRLLAIMETHRRSVSTRQSKATLVATLTEVLQNHALLHSIIAHFSQADQEALKALFDAGGRLPAVRFEEIHGPIRAYRPWQKEGNPEDPSEKPWLAPISASERLLYSGLIYHYPTKVPPGAFRQLLIPQEVMGFLTSYFAKAAEPGAAVVQLVRPGKPADLIQHLGLWLVTMAQEPVSIRHARWLPPTLLTTLSERMDLDIPLPCRSERYAPYLAFLHQLAEVAGLIQHGATLHLTPQAWAWMAASPPEQLADLWRAWIPQPQDPAAAAAERIRPLRQQAEVVDHSDRFRLDWDSLSPAARGLLAKQLQKLTPGHFIPLAEWVAQCRLLDYWGQLPSAHPRDWTDMDENGEPRLTLDPLVEFCRGPLFWLGIIDLAVDPASQRLSLSLTTGGAGLLGLAVSHQLAVHQPTPLQPLADEGDLLLAKPYTSLYGMGRVVAYCDWLPATEPIGKTGTTPRRMGGAQVLRLSPERIARAVAAGVTVDEILADLSVALGQPPSRRLGQRVRAWAKAGQRVSIRTVTILEAESAELMAELRRKKLVRRRLGPTIAPNRAIINPTEVAGLRQTLRTLNLMAVEPEESLPAARPAPAAPPASAELPAASAELPAAEDEPMLIPNRTQASGAEPALPLETQYLLLALYKALGPFTDLPVKIPWERGQTLHHALTPRQQMVAEAAVAQMIEGLTANLRGYLQAPAWGMWDVPEVNSRQIRKELEAAIANETKCTIRYWSANDQHPTTRMVTPYRLEEHANAIYLIAYCHLRHQERTFRLDRIEEVGMRG